MNEIFHSQGGALPKPAQGTLVQRTAGQDWQHSDTEGFLVKPLHEDPESGHKTWLMKVEPGAYAPLHAHEEYEEIYVLEGEFYDADNTYKAGDFAIRAPGTQHIAGSRNGAVVMLVFSRAKPGS